GMSASSLTVSGSFWPLPGCRADPGVARTTKPTRTAAAPPPSNSDRIMGSTSAVKGKRLSFSGSGASAASPLLVLVSLLGLLSLLLLLKDVKDLRHPIRDDVLVPGAFDFQVLVRDLQIFQLVHPPPRSLRPHRGVLIALHDDHGDVLELVEAGRLAERGRRDGRQAGPQVRVF